jgi:hypothetical protein
MSKLREAAVMTPQDAYEKRYANIDVGQHTWDAAPKHVKDMWLAAWTIAWAMAESNEREACAKVVENYCGAWDDDGFSLAQAIRARGNT